MAGWVVPSGVTPMCDGAAKFDPAGQLILSGYLGGSDQESAAGVAVDQAGNIYVAGTTASKDFPTTAGAYQTALSSHCAYPSSSVITGFIGTITEFRTDDAFVTKLDPAGNAIFATYLGGGCYDMARGMALDPSGNVWILGSTNSDPFPQVSPFQSGPPYAYYEAFLTELDAGGGSLRLSSYIEQGVSIAVDTNGVAWIGGTNAPPRSPYGGLPAPPLVVTGLHAWLAEVQPQVSGAVAIQSVGNAFNLRSGPVSPGQITLISAAGIAPAQPVDLGLSPTASLPRMLAGTQVLFDGEAAILISVAAGKAVVIAPYDLAGKARTSVQVVFQGVTSAPMLAEVLPDTGYRSLDGSGTGQAYAVNPDGTLNSPQNLPAGVVGDGPNHGSRCSRPGLSRGRRCQQFHACGELGNRRIVIDRRFALRPFPSHDPRAHLRDDLRAAKLGADGEREVAAPPRSSGRSAVIRILTENGAQSADLQRNSIAANALRLGCPDREGRGCSPVEREFRD